MTPPYLVLHREEFAWPRMSPHAPVRSYRTISPITRKRAGLFSVALVVARQSKPPDAPPLAGSLPYSVRTFLSRLDAGSNRPTCSLARLADYSKRVFNGYSHGSDGALAEVFEANAETVCPLRRDGERDGNRCDRMGKSKGKEIWVFLIDGSPDYPTEKCKCEE